MAKQKRATSKTTVRESFDDSGQEGMLIHIELRVWTFLLDWKKMKANGKCQTYFRVTVCVTSGCLETCISEYTGNVFEFLFCYLICYLTGENCPENHEVCSFVK